MFCLTIPASLLLTSCRFVETQVKRIKAVFGLSVMSVQRLCWRLWSWWANWGSGWRTWRPASTGCYRYTPGFCFPVPSVLTGALILPLFEPFRTRGSWLLSLWPWPPSTGSVCGPDSPYCLRPCPSQTSPRWCESVACLDTDQPWRELTTLVGVRSESKAPRGSARPLDAWSRLRLWAVCHVPVSVFQIIIEFLMWKYLETEF